MARLTLERKLAILSDAAKHGASEAASVIQELSAVANVQQGGGPSSGSGLSAAEKEADAEPFRDDGSLP